MIKQKIKASFAHLLISIVLVTLIVAAVIYFWYPIEYLKITNFKEILLLVICIDLVLGPLLTFVVFNTKKQSLHFDLAVVAIIQISALAYGVNALHKTHPQFITFNHGMFNLIPANEVIYKNPKNKDFEVSSLSSPKLAFAKMPDDSDKEAEIIIGITIDGDADISKRVEFYEPVNNNMDAILAQSLDSHKIFAEKTMTKESRKFLDKYNTVGKYAYLPLKGISADSIIVLEKESGKLVTTINTTPWKFAKKQ